MPRPRLPRRIQYRPHATFFKPRGVPMRQLEVVTLSLEELEALRLKNIKKLDQVVAAEQMQISQSTFQRILTSAHTKITDALVNGKALDITPILEEQAQTK